MTTDLILFRPLIVKFSETNNKYNFGISAENFALMFTTDEFQAF